MGRTIRTVGQRAAEDILDLLERATVPQTSALLDYKPRVGWPPPGFAALALLAVLFLAIAGVQVRAYEVRSDAPAPRAHLPGKGSLRRAVASAETR